MILPCLSISTSMAPASIRRENARVFALLIGIPASFSARTFHSFSVYRKRELSKPLVTTAPRLSELRYLTGIDSLPFSSTVKEYSPINRVVSTTLSTSPHFFPHILHFSPIVSPASHFVNPSLI